MLSPHRANPELDRALSRALAEEGRASRGAEVAIRHERLAHTGSPELRSMHECLARIHRDIEGRHRTAAALHRAHAERLWQWASGKRTALPPRFLASVAAALGARRIGLTLIGPDRSEQAVVSSDPIAAAAQELEFTIGEGPAHDAAASGDVVVVPEAVMAGRWAQYSPAVARLGVRSVAAAPLCAQSACFGALTLFNSDQPTALRAMADALVHSCLLAPDGADPTDVLVLAGADHRDVVHQAAGMLSERLRCAAGDALALLRARAFADDVPVGVLADQVVHRKVVGFE